MGKGIPITVAHGDGIGPEIMEATLRILEAAGAPLDIERIDIGTDGLKLRFRDKGLAQMVTEVGIITGKGRKVAA